MVYNVYIRHVNFGIFRIHAYWLSSANIDSTMHETYK